MLPLVLNFHQTLGTFQTSGLGRNDDNIPQTPLPRHGSKTKNWIISGPRHAFLPPSSFMQSKLPAGGTIYPQQLHLSKFLFVVTNPRCRGLITCRGFLSSGCDLACVQVTSLRALLYWRCTSSPPSTAFTFSCLEVN